jgi:predicted dehydrogenase
MSKSVKWGIIGLGKIAEKFATDLELVPGAELYAVASRSDEKAVDFARKFNVKKTYKGYAGICEDDHVDIIYVATPHHLHFQNSIDCLGKSKPVLCEKPATINKAQLVKVIDLARNTRTFYMEALWTKFLPYFGELVKRIDTGSIGEVISVRADFCFKTNFNPESRLYNRKLGGGSLLDIGIYPAFLAYQLMGIPKNIFANARIGQSGVDEVCSAILDYGNGKSAQILSSILFDSRMGAEIHGTTGSIIIPPRWHESAEFVIRNFGKEEVIRSGKLGKGYSHEIQACHDGLENNWIEHPGWSHQNSLELMEILDAIRKEIALTYPYD